MDRCRLAGAVGTEEAVDLPWAHLEVQVFDGDMVAVALAQVFRLDHGTASSSPVSLG
jgi:hypothetical protein